jgi:hypothetical protein
MKPISNENIYASFADDELYSLQLEVAHLADELCKFDTSIRGDSLECWKRAEKAVFESRLNRIYPQLVTGSN